MIMHIFTVYDKKAEVYGRPFYTCNRAVALRSFAEQVNQRDEQNDLNKYPEDFALYYLGEFDDTDAEFTILTYEGASNPEKLAEAADLVRQPN